MLLSKHILAVADLASDDDTRPMLTQLQVTKKNGKITAVATDSYILGEVVEETPDPIEFPKMGNEDNKPVNAARISKEVAIRALKTIPRKTVLPILNYAIVEKEAITTTNLDTNTRQTFREVEGDYPKYKKLIPEPAELQVGINPKLMIKALKQFGETENMTIEFGKSKLDPVILRSEGGGVKKTVVVMPLRR